jgi:spermidine synthase
MHIPIWKKWISQVLPLTLETASSDQNPDLAVMLDRGRLQLLSGNAIYSWDDLYHNFTIAFGTFDLDEEPIEDVLVLGFGLGSVPFILEKIFERTYHYTGVEWDETVAALASKYTLSRLSSPVEMVTADASIFIEVTQAKFDLVAIDIFEDDRTPDQFETVEFLEACAKRLRPGGLLLYNRLYNSPRNVRNTSHFFESTFLDVFPDAWKIDTGGNWVLATRKPK